MKKRSKGSGKIRYKGTLFGRLVTHRKYKGPFGALQSRKILSGPNKGKSALWY